MLLFLVFFVFLRNVGQVYFIPIPLALIIDWSCHRKREEILDANIMMSFGAVLYCDWSVLTWQFSLAG